MPQKLTLQKRLKKRKAWNIISWILAIFIFVIVGFEIFMKFRSEPIYLFGYRQDVVLTDSMASVNQSDEEVKEFLKGREDRLQVGDLVFSTKITNETEIKVYDVVLFKNLANSGRLTIHRVVDIYYDATIGQNKYVIRADSAKTSEADGAYTKSSLIAKMEFKWDKVGYVVYFFNSIYGILLLVFIFFVIFVLDFLFGSSVMYYVKQMDLIETLTKKL